MLKRVTPSRGVEEMSVNEWLFSTNEFSLDPRNHCVIPLEILHVPDAEEEHVVVMPFMRPFNEPRFETFGEFVAFCDQVFEVCVCGSCLITRDSYLI